VKNEINLPSGIYLYDETEDKIDIKKIKDFIKENFKRFKFHYINLKEKVIQTKGLLFDFIETQKAFEKIRISTANDCEIILTEKLFATLEQDRRPHIRASIYSFPSVISLSGIVEGPAKPKEFYIYKQKYMALGLWDLKESQVKKKFKEHFIDYGDKRIEEVLKGYISQAIFFYMTGEPFCRSKCCRLFNAHWQKDLIYSQIKIAQFCKKHQKILKKLEN